MLRDKNVEIFDDHRDTMNGFRLDELSNIECIMASHNVIRNIQGITQLTTLIELNLSFNQISDISGIEYLTLLEQLFLNNNRVVIINTIRGLKNLK